MMQFILLFYYIGLTIEKYIEKINLNKLLVCAGCHGQDNISAVSLLIEHGANPLYQNGKTIHEAGCKKNSKVVRYLLEKSNLNQNFLNMYASFCAMVTYNQKVVQAFLDNGAYIDLETQQVSEDVYDMIHTWNKSKILHDKLHDHLNDNEQPNSLKRRNKI